MIVKMKKYSFLIFHQEYVNFLEGIRNQGMVHINVKGEGELENEELNKNVHRLNRIKNALNGLERYMSEENSAPDSGISGQQALEKYEELIAKQEKAEHDIQHLERRLANLSHGETFLVIPLIS